MADTWYAIVDGSGNLISAGTVIADAATLQAKGYQAITLAGNPIGQIWDSATRSFSAAPATPIVLQTWTFIQLFTAAEYAAIRASTDPIVGQFLLMLQTATTVTLSDPVVINGVNYLVAQTLLTAARGAAVLAGQAPS